MFGILMSGLGYEAFAAGLPAWYTAVFGMPGEKKRL